MERGYELAGRSLFVALPAYDFKVSLKLAISLARVAQLAPQHGINIQIGSVCGCSVVSRARNLLVKDFLESSCTDLLFVDSDINFEPEDVFRLMAWATDPRKGVVAGVPRTRSENTVYITDLDYDEDNQLTMNGMGLVRARRVATAFMLVRREVFDTLTNAHPEWTYQDKRSERAISAVFDFKLTEEGYMGEDFLFCDRAREHGFEVWIDPTIKLGHMGITEFAGNFGEDILYPMLAPAQKVA
ncbi:hypothetical protein UFOVP1288_62 [uncultured Caudovirales phage]|uniref:Anp1 n=1 Tax=uncultured Caudovirales phage TaxID=2100421 RepID=A0A6J5RVZ4_9CAUD|nr:hypothetical protein UFOVP1195_62 [uncultured Caudovirales phage]CAB4196134.1 hypothetical protein UFOVP1288_62 [uncultured Caudovirales phage]CAB4205152.1 hypothetical protein UFOVP1409_62 [uncultured Caudovirales phage]